jgi:hypothetical protein
MTFSKDNSILIKKVTKIVREKIDLISNKKELQVD